MRSSSRLCRSSVGSDEINNRIDFGQGDGSSGATAILRTAAGTGKSEDHGFVALGKSVVKDVHSDRCAAVSGIDRDSSAKDYVVGAVLGSTANGVSHIDVITCDETCVYQHCKLTIV